MAARWWTVLGYGEKAHMKELSRFLIVGVLNTFVGYCFIFLFMVVVGLSPEISNFVGYIIGLSFSYFLNRSFTFRSTHAKSFEVIKFIGVFVISYAANFAILLVLIYRIGIKDYFSQMVAGVVYIGSSFVLNKYFVFKKIL